MPVRDPQLAAPEALPDGQRLRIVEDAGGNQTILLPRGPLAPPRPQALRGDGAWYVPYTAVHAATALAAPPSAVWIDVSSSNVAYYAALLTIWERGETFALIEHDVIYRPGIGVGFDCCPEPWCLHDYTSTCHPECREAWRNHLGCTRYRAELMRAVPDAVSSIPADNWDWHNVCDGLGNNLRAAGYTHHWHEPAVEHHRETYLIH